VPFPPLATFAPLSSPRWRLSASISLGERRAERRGSRLSIGSPRRGPASAEPNGTRSWLRVPMPFKTAHGVQHLLVALRCGGVQWSVSHAYKTFLAIDAQLRGHTEPSASPSVPSLPELPASSRAPSSSAVFTSASQSKHAGRVAALQAWLPAVLQALHVDALQPHSPLCALLELHTPFVVHLQASARGFLARQHAAVGRQHSTRATASTRPRIL